MYSNHYAARKNRQLDMPARLLRSKPGKRGSMRRSRSQPMHQGAPPDLERANASVVPNDMPSTSANASNSVVSMRPMMTKQTTVGTPTGEHAESRVTFDLHQSPSSVGIGDSTSATSITGADAANTSYRSSMHSTSSTGTNNSSSYGTDNKEDTNGIYAEAAWDHVAMQPDELPFRVGQIVHISDWSRSDVWFGTCDDKSGWFPVSHVRVLAEQPHRHRTTSSKPSPTTIEESRDSGHSSAEETDCSSDGVPSTVNTTISGNNTDRSTIRARIIDEILNTERDYLTLITRLVHGFLSPARQRPDLFPFEKIRVIFGNLESLLELHQRFMMDLENEYNKDDPAATCIGHCFLRHENSFEVYSNYCNNRPLSCAELAGLSGMLQYDKFFQCCRLLYELPALPLEGFLLTPVQRICRYPLQLAELVKATPSGHPDQAPCVQALTAMRRVANVINDRKRRLESLQKIALWQTTIQNWRGGDLLDVSSRLLHFGDVTCRCFTVSGQPLWTKDVTAFLFDNCLVLCKKDLLKRTQFVYKERILMNFCTFIDAPDGKDPDLNISVKHAIKLSLLAFNTPDSPTVHKNNKSITDSTSSAHLISQNIVVYYVLLCRNRKLKQHWVNAFAEELQLRQSPVDSPPGEEEKRIALAALRQPNGWNGMKQVQLDGTPKRIRSKDAMAQLTKCQ